MKTIKGILLEHIASAIEAVRDGKRFSAMDYAFGTWYVWTSYVWISDKMGADRVIVTCDDTTVLEELREAVGAQGHTVVGTHAKNSFHITPKN